jgi:predicted nucleotidyltransferase
MCACYHVHMPADSAFLSVRVPGALRGRVKQLAVRQQTSVQRLVQQAIEGYLREHDRVPPELGKAIAILRQHADQLRAGGVQHLFIFGSLVRGEADAQSDIDLAVDIAPDADVSLLDLVGLQQQTESLMGWPVDLVERKMLKRFVRPEVEREMIQIF